MRIWEHGLNKEIQRSVDLWRFLSYKALETLAHSFPDSQIAFLLEETLGSFFYVYLFKVFQKLL